MEILLNASLSSSLSFNEIFFPSSKNNNVANVINPKPPIWIKNKRTTSPKVEKVSPVSTTINPVTQVADVAVNKASKKGKPFPSSVENGIVKRNVPMAIMRAKPNTRTFGGFNAFLKLFILFSSILNSKQLFVKWHNKKTYDKSMKMTESMLIMVVNNDLLRFSRRS